MAKRVTCTIERYAGYVDFRDPLPLYVCLELEDAILSVQGKTNQTEIDVAVLPVVIKAVEEWHLKNIPDRVDANNFPGTPRKDSSILLAWLIGEMMKVYSGNEATEDPNTQGPAPTPTP